MLKRKVKYICSACHNDSVIFDGNVWWDVKKQKWVCDEPFDDPFCSDCHGECSTLVVPSNWKKGTPLPAKEISNGRG